MLTIFRLLPQQSALQGLPCHLSNHRTGKKGTNLCSVLQKKKSINTKVFYGVTLAESALSYNVLSGTVEGPLRQLNLQ